MMSAEGTGGPLARLAHAINTARQLTQNARGRQLPDRLADDLAERLRACARLLRGVQPMPQPPSRKAKSSPAQRRALWQRDPRCFWCGRNTRLDADHAAPDCATVEHVYQTRHPRKWHPRRQLPEKVLACYECNTGRGGYQGPPIIRHACPLVAPAGTQRVYRLKRRS